MNKFSYSTDGENFHHGDFDSVEAACQEAAAHVGARSSFWVGENVSPTQPEEWFDAELWLEHVSCQDEYSGDFADDWDGSTKEQREELEAAVQKVMAAWLDRHKLRPSFWRVINVRQYTVKAAPDGALEFELVVPVPVPN